MRREDDPRVAIVAGVLGLWLAGLATLTAVGAAPERGRRVNRALDAAARGETAVAARQLELLAEGRPQDPGGWIRAGRALLADGRARDAADRFARALALDSTSSIARYELANAFAEAWLDDEAEATLRSLLARRPDHAGGLLLGAALASSRGDVDAAVERFEAAIAAGASDPERWRAEPRFDPIRADPRFLRVARRPLEAASGEAP